MWPIKFGAVATPCSKLSHHSSSYITISVDCGAIQHPMCMGAGDRLNHLERLRDPSHLCFWRLSELFSFLKKARLALSVLSLIEWRDNRLFLDPCGST